MRCTLKKKKKKLQRSIINLQMYLLIFSKCTKFLSLVIYKKKKKHIFYFAKICNTKIANYIYLRITYKYQHKFKNVASYLYIFFMYKN